MLTIKLPIIAALAALAVLAPDAVTPARGDGIVSGGCVGSWGMFSCTRIWRRGRINPYVITVPKPRDEKDIAMMEERERLWVSRCAPQIRQDQYGVPRYVYAAPGCEFGRIR